MCNSQFLSMEVGSSSLEIWMKIGGRKILFSKFEYRGSFLRAFGSDSPRKFDEFSRISLCSIRGYGILTYKVISQLILYKHFKFFWRIGLTYLWMSLSTPLTWSNSLTPHCPHFPRMSRWFLKDIHLVRVPRYSVFHKKPVRRS